MHARASLKAPLMNCTMSNPASTDEVTYSPVPQLKPTYRGWSTYTTWAFLFQAYGLADSLPECPSTDSFTSKRTSGPCSVVAPSIAEQPGPPLDQSTIGAAAAASASAAGSSWLSKCQ